MPTKKLATTNRVTLKPGTRSFLSNKRQLHNNAVLLSTASRNKMAREIKHLRKSGTTGKRFRKELADWAGKGFTTGTLGKYNANRHNKFIGRLVKRVTNR